MYTGNYRAAKIKLGFLKVQIGQHCRSQKCQYLFGAGKIRPKAINTKYSLTLPQFDYDNHMLKIFVTRSHQVRTFFVKDENFIFTEVLYF